MENVERVVATRLQRTPLAWKWMSEVGSTQACHCGLPKSFKKTTYANSIHQAGEEPVSPTVSSGPRDCASLGICQLTDLSTRLRLSLMNIIKADESNSLACFCPREQQAVSSALDFFASGQMEQSSNTPGATGSLGSKFRCLTTNGRQHTL